jgi:hypothetical protein
VEVGQLNDAESLQRDGEAGDGDGDFADSQGLRFEETRVCRGSEGGEGNGGKEISTRQGRVHNGRMLANSGVGKLASEIPRVFGCGMIAQSALFLELWGVAVMINGYWSAGSGATPPHSCDLRFSEIFTRT